MDKESSIAHVIRQQRYLATDKGKEARRRDEERRQQGYRALRAQGIKATLARRLARQEYARLAAANRRDA